MELEKCIITLELRSNADLETTLQNPKGLCNIGVLIRYRKKKRHMPSNLLKLNI